MIVKSETRTMVSGSSRYSYRDDGRQYILYKEYKSGGKPIGHYNTFNALLSAVPDRKPPAQTKPERRMLTGRNQCDLLLEHYRSGGSITTLEASRLFGVTQLSSRNIEINRKLALEGSEHRVVSERIKVPTRSGKQASVCKYYLGKDQ